MLRAGTILFQRQGFGISTWGFSGTQSVAHYHQVRSELGSQEVVPMTQKLVSSAGCRAVHLLTPVCFPISQ